MEITNIGIDKLEDLVNLEQLCFPKDYYSREVIEEQCEDCRTFIYGVKEGRQIIAQISIYNWKGEKDYIKLVNLGVHPERRNQGYAHALIRHAIDYMQSEGLSILKAETRISNEAMRKVFENLGFNQISEIAGYYDSPTETACVYTLTL